MTSSEIDRYIQRNYNTSSTTTLEQLRLLQYLCQRGSTAAMRHVIVQQQQTSQFCTTAVSELAVAKNTTCCILAFLDDLQRCNASLDSFTVRALFQAAKGVNETLQLKTRLMQDYPQVTWTATVWEAALYALGRTSSRADDEPEALPVALQLVNERGGAPLTNGMYQALLSLCAKSGNVTFVVTLLEQMPNKTPRAWGAAFQACAVAQDEPMALLFLKNMTLSGTKPNIRHYTSYMKALISAEEGLLSAVQFLDHISGNSNVTTGYWEQLPSVELDLVVFHTILHALVSAEDFGTAKLLLDRMKRGEFGASVAFPDEQCYHLVLAASRDSGQALDVIQEMRLSRRYRVGAVPPNQITYTRAIAVCRKNVAPDVQAARFLLQRARDDGVLPDIYMYSAAIWTAASAGDAPAASAVFEEMIRDGIVPNVVVFNGRIAAHIASGDIKSAVSMYVDMMEANVPPSLATFQLLAKAVRSVKSIEGKMSLLVPVFEKMGSRERRIAVGGPVIEALINAYGSFGMYAEARRVYDLVQGPVDSAVLRAILFACSTGTPPAWKEALSILHSSDVLPGTYGPTYVDSVAVSNTMLACSKAGQWEESLQLLRLYGNSDTSVLAINSLIGSCGRNGRPDMALEVLNVMEAEFGIIPDERSYRNAIIACNQAEHERHRNLNNHEVPELGRFRWWECAVSLLRRMEECSLRPDIQSYSSVISACEAAGEWQRALSILESVINESSMPMNVYCLNAAISACAKGGAWIEALEVYERMKEHSEKALRPTVVTLGSIVVALDKAGQKELAQSVYRDALRDRIINPWRTTQTWDGKHVRAMDLHKFSAALARTALRNHIESLLGSSRVPSLEDDWIIVVGKGLRSQESPVLMPSVGHLLQYEYGIESTVDPRNKGRIVVRAEILRDFVTRNRWR